MGTTPDRQYGRELATEPEVAARIAAHSDGTLLHDLDRAARLSIVRDPTRRAQFVRYEDDAAGTLIRETEIVRDAWGRAAVITDRQFEPPGSLARTRVVTLVRDGSGRVSAGSVVVT